MQELFNLVNVRQMYKQEGKLQLVDSLDKLILIILEQMISIPEAPLVPVIDNPILVADTTTTPSTVPNVFA